ncbi:MAG TPA: glycine cleavage T C-terminal barrel domain-containing protein, partial [Candidatus Acidoferrales bacterium]|nr:glycine cleavage T C-terminal barrel domain-containing protein [Candidatus Acidoferrales bacterium]
LNAVVTNNIRDLAIGQGAVSLLLNSQGHILAELEAYIFPDRIRIVTYAMIRQQTFATLDKFIIMDDAVLTDRSGEIGAIALEGPRAVDVLASLGAPAIDPIGELAFLETELAGVRCELVKRSPGGIAGAEIVARTEDLPRLWQIVLEAVRKFGGGPLGYEALSVLRLEAGIAWFGYDFDSTVIPHEAALENSHVSFTKGCYTGQEIVERVRSRGHVNRKRVGVVFSGREVPAPKTPLLASGAEVGYVTRAGFSYALDRPVGMAYLRSEHNAVGSRVSYAGGEAEVIALPLTVSAQSANPR